MGGRPRRTVTTPATRERRVGIRVAVDTYIRVAVVQASSGAKLHGWVRNLSPGGLFVESLDAFDSDEAVTVDALARHGDAVLHLRVDGWVAYSGPNGMGIQFAHLTPEMTDRVAELLDCFS